MGGIWSYVRRLFRRKEAISASEPLLYTQEQFDHAIAIARLREYAREYGRQYVRGYIRGYVRGIARGIFQTAIRTAVQYAELVNERLRKPFIKSCAGELAAFNPNRSPF
jgi:hypothetical protein